MSYSTESLEAFMQAANLGTFSAAARKLGKSQSTISEAIARLEIDLGVELFDRSAKLPVLTEAGRALLQRAEDVLSASERLRQAADLLNAGVESRLTLVISDAYDSPEFQARLHVLGERYPELEFECVFAEYSDALNLVRTGRAALGILPSEPDYPPEIGHVTLAEQAEFAVFVAKEHALASLRPLNRETLGGYRALRLNTLDDLPQRGLDTLSRQRSWSAPSYLILMELASEGFGWAILPRWLVRTYAAHLLVELQVPGWPRHYPLDLVWSKQRSLGPAGAWLREALIAEQG
ncbi:MAG: LysR family transcriptional regulator [Paucimonas sp.]|jgi:DNA-binding transcriptional LysR family regulator|nr:LysR family transcriptional regulator [Paucimonas sp.]